MSAWTALPLPPTSQSWVAAGMGDLAILNNHSNPSVANSPKDSFTACRPDLGGRPVASSWKWGRWGHCFCWNLQLQMEMPHFREGPDGPLV